MVKLIDKSKLTKFLLDRLVIASRERETSQMNMINEIILQVDNGAFDFDYTRITKAVNDYSNYIKG